VPAASERASKFIDANGIFRPEADAYHATGLLQKEHRHLRALHLEQTVREALCGCGGLAALGQHPLVYDAPDQPASGGCLGTPQEVGFEFEASQ
jgi:hypothetical protein